MFIERSSARIRAVRTLFILLGLAPCIALGAWAAVRHSRSHRDTVAARFGATLGLPVRVGRVEHRRPHSLRAVDVDVVLPGEAAPVRLPVVDLEWSASEVRVRVDSLACDPSVVRAVARLAREWLEQPARFPHDCVVEVTQCRWEGSTAGNAPADPSGLRVEGVAAHGSRAVRLLRGPGGGAAGDEVRAVCGVADGAPRLDVTGRIGTPLSVGVVMAAVGGDERSSPLGAAARLSGAFEVSVRGDTTVEGTARGRIERIDIATVCGPLSRESAGEAACVIDEVVWRGGRIERIDAILSAVHGQVGQRLLDALVATLGCRPGPAYRALDRDHARGFDAATARISIDRQGMALRSPSDRSASLIEVQGLSIVDEPGRIIPLDRLAWLVSPATAPAVPASSATARLLDILPLGGGPPADAAAPRQRQEPSQAATPRSRSGF